MYQYKFVEIFQNHTICINIFCRQFIQKNLSICIITIPFLIELLVFNFSGTERVKQNQKKIESYSKPPKLVKESLLKQFQ